MNKPLSQALSSTGLTSFLSELDFNTIWPEFALAHTETLTNLAELNPPSPKLFPITISGAYMRSHYNITHCPTNINH